MFPAVLQNEIFQNEIKAREWLEARIWPNGPVCPHCGVAAEHITKLEGEKHRPGVYQCNECREQFTVTVKTVFERSHIPLTKWLAALFLMTASKKGVSAHQMHRMLKISYKSTWFMCHRLREAMRPLNPPTMGGKGQIVEADETYIGRLEGQPKRRAGYGHKNAVLTLVERGGSARSFHIDSATIAEIAPIVRENIKREAALMTDEGSWYEEVGGDFDSHETVRHSAKEYVRGNVPTNTVEGFYSIFKRGMKGVYQHCKEKHLHRYISQNSISVIAIA